MKDWFERLEKGESITFPAVNYIPEIWQTITHGLHGRLIAGLSYRERRRTVPVATAVCRSDKTVCRE